MIPLADRPDVLTVRETAEVLRIGMTACYDRIREGAIPSIRLGHKLLVPKCQLIRLLDGEGAENFAKG